MTYSPFFNYEEFLGTISRYQTDMIKRVIGANISSVTSRTTKEKKEVNLDFNKLGELSPSMMEVLKGCSLMRHLVGKAVSTGYLGHFERLSLLDVFGNVGDDGKAC